MRVLVLLSLLVLAGCPTPVCDPTDTRCVGNVAEICTGEGQWETMLDCAAEGMVCCWVEEDPVDGIPAGHTCLPECPAATDGGE